MNLVVENNKDFIVRAKVQSKNAANSNSSERLVTHKHKLRCCFFCFRLKFHSHRVKQSAPALTWRGASGHSRQEIAAVRLRMSVGAGAYLTLWRAAAAARMCSQFLLLKHAQMTSGTAMTRSISKITHFFLSFFSYRNFAAAAID